MEVERVQGKVFEEAAGFPTQYGPDRSDRGIAFDHDGVVHRGKVFLFELAIDHGPDDLNDSADRRIGHGGYP